MSVRHIAKLTIYRVDVVLPAFLLFLLFVILLSFVLVYMQ